MAKRNKTKIVLDSDVVIHFIKGERFTLLFNIFPEYQYLILDTVYWELSKCRQTKTFIDNVLQFMNPQFQQVEFSPNGVMMKEYASLVRTLGRGESACMVYCLEHHDVLGSSNLKDIKEYCEMHGITYLTTLDFLYYAYMRKKITKEECDDFMQRVVGQGSKLPIVDISTYMCRVII